jgi:TolB-like protein/tetratricopeptide (TPR) repeat protein
VAQGPEGSDILAIAIPSSHAMDSVREQLQQALGVTYRVERELGGGGMSRVFLSTETALGRQVVLKVLPPELASGVSIERFKREISLAARLQHAHIVPLLATGDANGLPWFAMPFVEGVSLRTRLHQGELPIADVVRTLREVASALAYAHGKGVVHRDIKPENLLMSEGAAVVTDFGVAKALADAGEERSSPLTSVGITLGTPAYMAPEQIAGDTRIDHRADIYALGVVAYEMLCGHNPFGGRAQQATLAAHMVEHATPIERLRSATPPALAQLVARCMAKSAADRPQSAQDVVNALDAMSTPSGTIAMAAGSSVAHPVSRRRSTLMVSIAAGVGIVIAVAWYTLAHMGGRGAELNAQRVAVVPFENLTGDESLDIVGRVASEELSRSIAQTDSADVVAGDAVITAMGESARSEERIAERVARATGAAIIVLGSYSRFGDSLRMQVSLVNAASGKVLRALDPTIGSIAEPMVAIAALRERLLGSIVSGDLARKVTLASTPPKYTAYLELLAGAREFVKNQAASRAYFERAIALDSTFVGAYGLLAATYTNAGLHDEAERVIERLRAHRDRLSSLDRLKADFVEQNNLGTDAAEILRLAQELLRRTSDPYYAYIAGYWALGELKPGLALVALAQSDSFMVQNGWVGQIRDEALAHHLLEDFHQELATLDRGIARLPQFAAYYAGAKLRAFAGLRDLASARALADTLLSQRSNPGTAVALDVVFNAASEFDAHGDSAGGQQLNRMALDWARENAPRAQSLAWERVVGRLWLFAGALDSAEAHFARALSDSSASGIATVASLAMISARQRDVARARAVSDSLAANVPKWDLGRTAYRRATILAELGDLEQAMRLLTLATQSGQVRRTWHMDPSLRALRGYPPFAALSKAGK